MIIFDEPVSVHYGFIRVFTTADPGRAEGGTGPSWDDEGDEVDELVDDGLLPERLRLRRAGGRG